MATMVYTDAYVSVNGVDLSDHVKSVSLTYEAEMLDDTVMGTTGTRSNKPGLKNWSVSVDFLQDHDPGSVDETLFPLVGADKFPFALRPKKAAAASATNPQYQGLAVLESYPPLTGEVGALGTASCSLRCASDLQRSVTGVLLTADDEKRLLSEDEKKLPQAERTKLVEERKKKEDEEKAKAGASAVAPPAMNPPQTEPGPPRIQGRAGFAQ